MVKQKINLSGSFSALIALTALFLLLVNLALSATPEGPTITLVSNTTKAVRAPEINNGTGGTSGNQAGGYIFTNNLNTLQRNTKWKAYVGNVSGTLTLDDASGNTIYKWPVLSSSLVGNVYATRTSSVVTWSSIECANLTHIEAENIAINHTSAVDNITTTFNASSAHSAFTIAGTSLTTCRSTSTYVNDLAQSQTSTDTFQEIVTYDGTNIVYATKVENHVTDFAGTTSDFQILIPEIGLATWASSTAYYFYVEIQ